MVGAAFRVRPCLERAPKVWSILVPRRLGGHLRPRADSILHSWLLLEQTGQEISHVTAPLFQADPQHAHF